VICWPKLLNKARHKNPLWAIPTFHNTLRIEFGVTRFDDVKPNAPISGRRYPACRLVLPPVAAVDLINRMQQIAAALTQAGVVKAAQRPAAAPSRAP
jgi:hypothetical protein